MATSLGDMFDGATTGNGTSDSQAITAGDYILAVQGVSDGCRVMIEANVFGSSWDAVDGVLVDKNSTGFAAFRICAGNVRATVVEAGTSTSITVGILPA